MEHTEIRGIKITETTYVNPLFATEKKNLYLNSKRLKRSFRYLKKYNIKSIVISEQFFEYDNLEILKKFDCDRITEVSIKKEFDNLNTLNIFKNLQVLTIGEECKNSELDFSEVSKKLKLISVNWSSKFKNFNELSELISCKIWYLKKDDLTILSDFKKLIRLELVNGTVKSLIGIENLSNLKEIHLYYLKYLKNFNGISKNHKNLEVFFTYSIPNIEQISSIGNAENLKVLQISKTNKEYDTFKFLDKLKKLERVKMICEKVSDKDLEPLNRMRDRTTDQLNNIK
ncbi:hypothetical protein [Thalassobellus sediminis]|uniref:hypothetical protein n=1 Tax=Thalassobellus sediminis TaxID=3367753 RepID=UPI0037873206